MGEGAPDRGCINNDHNNDYTFPVQDQVCISTTLRELDKVVLTQRLYGGSITVICSKPYTLRVLSQENFRYPSAMRNGSFLWNSSVFYATLSQYLHHVIFIYTNTVWSTRVVYLCVFKDFRVFGCSIELQRKHF